MSFQLRIKNDTVLRFGNRDDPEALSIWAELGRIHFQNERTGEYSSLSRRDFLERLDALNSLNSKGSSVKSIYDVTERERIARFVEKAIDLVRKAKEQGDPDDANVRRQRAETLTKPVSFSGAKRSSLILPAGYEKKPDKTPLQILTGQ